MFFTAASTFKVLSIFTINFIFRVDVILGAFTNRRQPLLLQGKICKPLFGTPSGDLNTAYEWLAQEKMNAYLEYKDTDIAKDLGHFDVSPEPEPIIWTDIVVEKISERTIEEGNFSKENLTSENGDDDGFYMTLPLYPLDACYLPQLNSESGEFAILRNVEPRNIKMALDLKESKSDDAKVFCAVLRATDTGKVANVGTVMKIVDFDEQYLWDGTLARIILKCLPIERVYLSKVINPEAWSREERIKRSDKYLIAQVNSIEEVKINVDDIDYISNADIIHACSTEIFNNFQVVKRMYEKSNDVLDHYPPFAIDALSSLPELPNITDENTFWSALSSWQKLCFTIKEAERINLQAEINEKSISAALAKGGPLNLPVHREDLDYEVRRDLDQMEYSAAKDFIDKGVEPCLDFQVLLGTPKLSDRLSYFHFMILRERRRLEKLQKVVM